LAEISPVKLILGGIMHETHSFSAEPTTVETFRIWRGDEILSFAGTNHSVGGTLDACASVGIEAAPTYFADALSTSPPNESTFDAMSGELCARIRDALPVDGVVLNLHGAMVAEGHPDAEGSIVSRVREVIGDDVPIAVTLDFHANIGHQMVDAANIVTTYDTYPHTDAAERAREAVGLLARTIREEIHSAMALVKPPLMPVPQAQSTRSGPFATLMERAHALEEAGEALTITIAGGFAYSDVPDAGMTVLVTTDGDRAAAERMAGELARMAWAMREQMLVHNTPPDHAVRDAMAYPDRPVVLVDVGDNIGGGTPGDGTVILAELLGQGARDATIVIADPEAAERAIEAGPGATVDLLIGGKTDRLHGNPVPVTGQVKRYTDGRWVHEGPENAGVPVESGKTAVVRSGGVDIVLTSKKIAPGDQQQLKSVGIQPAEQQIIVVKAAVRWRGGYGPITKHAIPVDTPGLGSADLSRFDYRRIRRPIYPLDQETEWDGGG
jgi:microcystin degradation protein MlrC